MMSLAAPRTIRRLCYAASGLLLAAAAGLVAWGWHPPAPPDAPPALAVKSPAAAESAAETQLASWEALWRKRLQGGAAEAPPPEETPTEAMPAPKSATAHTDADAAFGLRLAGTVLESGKSMAVLIDNQGRILLRSAGDSIATDGGPVSIQRIELHSVALAHQGREVTLRLSSNSGGEP